MQVEGLPCFPWRTGKELSIKILQVIQDEACKVKAEEGLGLSSGML